MLPNEITLGKFSNIVKNRHTLQIHFSVYHHCITNAMTIPVANNCFYFSHLRNGITFPFFMNANSAFVASEWKSIAFMIRAYPHLVRRSIQTLSSESRLPFRPKTEDRMKHTQIRNGLFARGSQNRRDMVQYRQRKSVTVFRKSNAKEMLCAVCISPSLF